MNLLPLLLLVATPNSAQISSGGEYKLERSAVSSGGELQLGGRFSARATIAPSAASQVTLGPVLYGGSMELRLGLLNPPPFSFQAGTSAVLELEGGAVSLVVPAGAVPFASFDIAFKQDPVSNLLFTDPNSILEANRKLEANDPLARIRPENIWEFRLVTYQGYFTSNFASPPFVSFAYADADGDGMVDGTNPPVRAKTLSIWTLDEKNSRWVKVPGVKVDTVARTVSVELAQFSVHAFVGGTDQDVEGVFAYPVPFRPHGPNAGLGPGQTGTAATGITFTNLPNEGKIEIFTLSGQLVRKIDIPFGLGISQLSWDVRNYRGEAVASGVYIWKVSSRNAFKTGRLMVIR